MIYQSPELTSQEKYNKSSEYWAVGVLAYELVARTSPFEFGSTSQSQVIFNILKNKYKMLEKFSPELKDFIRKLLKTSPDARMNLAEAKAHPWLRQTRFDSSSDAPLRY